MLFGFVVSVLLATLGKYLAKRWFLYLMVTIIGTEIGLLVNAVSKQDKDKSPGALGSAKPPKSPEKEVAAGGK